MTRTVELHHVAAGPSIREDSPLVVLGHALGATHRMWDDLAEALAPTFRVVRFDVRGHGGSPAPAAPYTMEELAADVVALVDRLGVDRFAYVGISLGGAIGQRLAIDRPDRISALVLSCTAPVFGNPGSWQERAATVRERGTGALVDGTVSRWFTPAFRAEHPDTVARVMDMLRETPDDGYVGCCAALERFDTTAELPAIQAPTLVIAGAEDPTCPPTVGRAMAESIPGSRLEVVSDTAHMAPIARPEAFRTLVNAHLDVTLR